MLKCKEELDFLMCASRRIGTQDMFCKILAIKGLCETKTS